MARRLYEQPLLESDSLVHEPAFLAAEPDVYAGNWAIY